MRGGGGGDRSHAVQQYTGAQINFGDLTPYLTHASYGDLSRNEIAWLNGVERDVRDDL